MSRSLRLTLAACLSLATFGLAHSQDTQNSTPATPVDASAPAGDDIAALKAENAELKKEVSDAKQTIATLQSQLSQAGINHTSPTEAPDTTAAASTNAAPAGPLKALPLDATNVVANPAAPGAPAADAAPAGSKTYTVVKGDSLWKIAHKMYPGDTKNGVDKLQEANKDAIGGKPLKIGQVLIVPQ
jgi:nucleoid-associated protein YgaU